MNPVELMDICMASINDWNAAEHRSEEPMVLLVVPRELCPSGETIALLGRGGPRGRIANVRETERGYDVVAYFPAVAVLNEIARAVGHPAPVVTLYKGGKGQSGRKGVDKKRV